MPYIKQEDRDRIMKTCGPLESPGELNFAITMLVQEYLGEDPNYQKFNDAIGALEGAKLELYRKQVAPYEDVKIRENGDVFPSNDDISLERLKELIHPHPGVI